MKFVVSSNAMLSHVQAVSNKIIGGKPIQPILDNVLLVATEEALFATASDKETTMEARIALDQIIEPGSITIPAKNLLDLLKEFPEQPLTFDINESTGEIKIITENGEFVIRGESAVDYPLPGPTEDNTTDVTTKCGLILDGLSKTIFATANDELRPVMNCVLIEMNNECFTFVASDAHKLVRYKRFDAKTENGDYSLILPKKPASILRGILAKDDSDINISFSSKSACFVFGDYKMTCTLVEGRFPNYNAVIPASNAIEIIFEKKTLYNALRRVSVMASQSSSLVKFQLNAGLLTVSAQDLDYSTSGHETLSCQYEGDEFIIGFKSTFVQEILSNIEATNIILKLSDPTRPGIFVPFENEEADEDLLMLLMPMMV